MNSKLRQPVLGLLAAIGVTTAMDATGYGIFSALPLWPLAGLFWFLQKIGRREIGLTWGTAKGYLWAAMYPIFVLGALGFAANLAGAVDISEADWGKAGRNILLMGGTTVLVTILTEEGFFRGWLWASLSRIYDSRRKVLLISSVGFACWHISAVVFMEELTLPLAQMPVYMANVVLIGLNWGLMRQQSGSLVVPSLSHGIWNGITYVLFGFGTHEGELGIAATSVWGPETGWVGLIANGMFFIFYRRWLQR